MAEESSVLVRMRLIGAAVMARDTKAVSRALGEMERTTGRSGRSFGGLGRESAAASAGLSRLHSTVGSVANGMASVESGGRRVVGVLGMVAGVASAAAAATGASYNAMQDRQRVAFTAMLGSAAKAESVMARISKLAAESPSLDPGNAGQAVQRMIAYGLSVDQAFKATERIGDSAAASGKSVEEAMGPAALAIGQIQSKGKLSAEELNQLAESVAVGRKSVARELGMSGQEFDDALRQGAIGAEEGLSAIFAAMQKTSGGAAKLMADTTAGEFDRFKEVLASGAGALTRPFYDALGNLAGGLADRLVDDQGRLLVDLEGLGKRIFGAVASAAAGVASVVQRIDWDAVLGAARTAIDWISARAPAVVAAIGEFAARVPGIAAGAADAVSQVVDALRPAMPFVQNVVLPLLKGVAIGVIGGVVAAFKVAVPVIKVLATALGWIGEKAKPLRPLIEGVGVVLGFLFGGVVLRGIAAVGKTIGAVGGAVGVFGRVLSVAARMGAVPIRFLQKVAGGAGRAFGLFGRAARGVGRALFAQIAKLRRFVAFMKVGFLERVSRIAVNVAWRFARGIAAMPGAARRIGSAVVRGIGRSLGTLPGRAWKWISGLARSLGGGRVITAVTNAARRIGKAIIDAIVTAIKAAPGAVAEAIKSVVPGPVQDAVGLAGNAASKLNPKNWFAGGGLINTPMAVVGERGPELIRAPLGSRVYPAGQSRQMMRAGAAMAGGGEVLTANLTVYLDSHVVHRGVHQVERQKLERR